MNISELIPDSEALLAMHPSQLAGLIITVMNRSEERGSWHPANFSNATQVKAYPEGSREECLLALMEAWSFLVAEGLLIPRPGDANNWHILSRLGMSPIPTNQ